MKTKIRTILAIFIVVTLCFPISAFAKGAVSSGGRVSVSSGSAARSSISSGSSSSRTSVSGTASAPNSRTSVSSGSNGTSSSSSVSSGSSRTTVSSGSTTTKVASNLPYTSPVKYSSSNTYNNFYVSRGYYGSSPFGFYWDYYLLGRTYVVNPVTYDISVASVSTTRIVLSWIVSLIALGLIVWLIIYIVRKIRDR